MVAIWSCDLAYSDIWSIYQTLWQSLDGMLIMTIRRNTEEMNKFFKEKITNFGLICPSLDSAQLCRTDNIIVIFCNDRHF